MQPLSLHILKTMDLIYKESNKDALIPHPKTVFNILKGNSESIHAKPFHESDFFGKYKNLKQKAFDDALTYLEESYVDIIKKRKKVRFVLKPKARHLLDGETPTVEKNNSLYNKTFHSLYEHT